MRKKSLVAVSVVIFCCTTYLSMNASDSEIAKTYLRRAMINRDNSQISLHMINEAKEYSVTFPEYEFLQLENCRNTGNFSNAEKYLRDMLVKRNKAFLLDDYDIDLQAARIYHYLHSYKEALPFYESAVGTNGKKTYGNYLEYLSCLFLADAPKSQVLPVLQKVSSLFSNQEIVFYQILYSFKFSESPFGEPIRLIRQLENNGYYPQEILYLKSFLVKDEEELGRFAEKMSQMSDISKKWGRDIVYGLLERFTVTDENILRKCLSLWKEYDGNNDVRTFRFLTYSPLGEWIKSNEDFAQWVTFSGVRVVDTDDNGKPELTVKVKDGIVINRSEDKNQDGIIENEFIFYDNGKIDEIFVRDDYKNYWNYNFNQYDSSLLTAENIRAGNVTEKNYMLKGAFVFNENQPLPILQDSLVDYREEYFDGEILRIKFSDGKIVLKEKDSDSDGFFEYSAHHKNGVISEAFIDMNKDGEPDLHEIYHNGKLVQCESGYSKTTGVYYYKEIFQNSEIEKYWDNNKDLVYELLEKTLTSGIIQSYFDLNNDGTYDYLHERMQDGSYGVYTLNSDRTKKHKITSVSAEKRAKKMKGWIVISSRNADLLPIPDEINFSDIKSECMKGAFSYKNQKFYFSDGLLKSSDFNFRLVRNGEKLFLFDCGA